MHETLGDGYVVDGGKRVYADEDPGVRDATQFRHEEANSFQEEIANVIRSEGYSLNSPTETIAQMNQLNTAIDKKVNDGDAAEASARAAAISAEASTRAAADSSLQTSIGNIEVRETIVSTANWDHISGLQMSYLTGGGANNYKITIGRGGAVSDEVEPFFSDNPVWMKTRDSVVKTLNAVWGAIPSEGGRASAIALSTGWYHVFIIGRSESNGYPVCDTVDFGFDTSLTAANLKTDTGWGSRFMYRRIGSVYYNGSYIWKFKQHGDLFYFEPPYLDNSIPDLTATKALVQAHVPTGVNVRALISTRLAVSGGTYVIANYLNGDMDQLILDVSPNNPCPAVGGWDAIFTNFQVITDADGKFGMKVAALSGNPIYVNEFITIGYEDFRGKDVQS